MPTNTRYRRLSALLLALVLVLIGGHAGSLAQPMPSTQPGMLPDRSIKYEDATILWRGFHHTWTYNHRLNRLGDFIDNLACTATPCSADLVHTAASGTGKDTATYTSFFTKIAANDVGFKAGHHTFTMRGTENSTIGAEEDVSLTARGTTLDRSKYEVVLNGFDLVAVDGTDGTSDADKLIFLFIELSDVTYDAATDKINFTIKANLEADCSSLECHLGGDKSSPHSVDYQLRVSYVVIAGGNGLKLRDKSFDIRYSWEAWPGKEMQLHTQRGRISGDASGDFLTSALAFKRLRIELDKEHHMLETDLALKPVSYNAEGGQLYFDLDLFFKQWKPAMPNPLAFTDAGSAFIEAKVVSMQFKDALVETGSVSSSINWPGENQSANSSAATKTKTTSFSF